MFHLLGNCSKISDAAPPKVSYTTRYAPLTLSGYAQRNPIIRLIPPLRIKNLIYTASHAKLMTSSSLLFFGNLDFLHPPHIGTKSLRNVYTAVFIQIVFQKSNQHSGWSCNSII